MLKIAGSFALSVLLVVAAMAQTVNPARPVNVEIRHEGFQFQFLRAGQPYFVKGGITKKRDQIRHGLAVASSS